METYAVIYAVIFLTVKTSSHQKKYENCNKHQLWEFLTDNIHE